MTTTRPIEGYDRCACGSKYWDGDRCHSCGDRFRPDPRHDIIDAIRNHPEIGRGSCSVIDECFGDDDLIAMFGLTDGGAYRTPKGAVRKALAHHRVFVAVSSDVAATAF